MSQIGLSRYSSALPTGIQKIKNFPFWDAEGPGLMMKSVVRIPCILFVGIPYLPCKRNLIAIQNKITALKTKMPASSLSYMDGLCGRRFGNCWFVELASYISQTVGNCFCLYPDGLPLLVDWPIDPHPSLFYFFEFIFCSRFWSCMRNANYWGIVCTVLYQSEFLIRGCSFLAIASNGEQALFQIFISCHNIALNMTGIHWHKERGWVNEVS